MSNEQGESLAGSETPSAKLMLKWIGIVLALAAVTVIVVGLLLPRQWHVEASVEVEAEVEAIHALVSDVERWDAWMFNPEAAPEDMQIETELGAAGAPVGSTIRWSGKGSSGAITIVEADPTAGIRWDGRIETDEINNHGRIDYEVVKEGTGEGDRGLVRVTLVDEGTLPPVFGGYFVPIMNSALSQHFSAALGRLEVAAEGT